MAVAEQIIQFVIIVPEGVVSPLQAILRGARRKAGEHQQDQQKNYTSTENAGMTWLIASLLVDEPFQEQNDACSDEHSWPPAAVPLERLSPGDSAHFGEEEHHSNAEDDQRTDNGAAAIAASLRS